MKVSDLSLEEQKAFQNYLRREQTKARKERAKREGVLIGRPNPERLCRNCSYHRPEKPIVCAIVSTICLNSFSRSFWTPKEEQAKEVTLEESK